MKQSRRGWLLLGLGLLVLSFPACYGRIEPLNGEPAASVSGHEEMRVIATVPGPIDLETVPVRVPVVGNAGQTLASHLATLGPGERIYLVLQDLRATEQPGALYHLYLDLPPGAKPAQNDPRYIGTFNFYNAIPIGDGNGEAPRTFKSPRFYSYDITGLARTLRERGMLDDRATVVTIQAGGTPTPGARPVIGRIELVVQ